MSTERTSASKPADEDDASPQASPSTEVQRREFEPRLDEGARLVIGEDFPDPGVLEVGGGYCAYATNSNGWHVQLATAARLEGPWRRQPDVLPSLPRWIGPDQRGSLNIWAPDVSMRADGGFLLHYTAFHSMLKQQCVAAAISDTPLGPFVPLGTEPLIWGAERGDVLDPATFIDDDGSRYLLYKDSLGGTATIRLRSLDEDGLTPLGADVPLLQADRAEEDEVIEAPTLVRRPEGYVLFFSANRFDSGSYFINYAISTDVTGPYRKADGALLSREVFGGAIVDPGGQDVVSTDEGDRIVFHGDLAKPGGPRGMYVAPLSWDGLQPRLGM